jgi:hypothetical protein
MSFFFGEERPKFEHFPSFMFCVGLSHFDLEFGSVLEIGKARQSTCPNYMCEM